jgi:hypothetical protein
MLAQHPEQTDRAIAAQAGVGKDTVRRARKAVGAKAPTGTRRTGQDGKTYKPTKRAQRPNGHANGHADVNATADDREQRLAALETVQPRIWDFNAKLEQLVADYQDVVRLEPSTTCDRTEGWTITINREQIKQDYPNLNPNNRDADSEVADSAEAAH